MNGMIIILSGPSGAGKGRICEELLKRRGQKIRKSISVTTRPKREEDEKSENYIFVPEEQFLEMNKMGMFFETNYYDGSWYGTTRIPLEELTIRDLVFDKDVNGALAIKEAYPEAITIYVMPKDNETLLERRGNRGERRAEIAKEEVPKAKQLDFLVINDDIDSAVDQVEEIIECMRVYSTTRRWSMKNKKNVTFMDNFYN